MAKYYVNNSGQYLGGFEGDTFKIPPGSIEVPSAPSDARFIWDGIKWVEPAPLKDVFVEEKIDSQVSKEVALDDKVNALWLFNKGDKSEFDRIEAIIAKAIIDNPK